MQTTPLRKSLGILLVLTPLLAGAASYGDLPLTFEPNRGQTDREAKFLARGRGYTIFVTGTGAVLQSRGRQSKHVRLTFPGATAAAVVEGMGPLPGRSNYLLGYGATPRVTDIPQYGRVRVHDMYPGIDLVYYGSGGALEYDFLVAPGADPRRIRIRFDGAGAPRINADGELVFEAGDAMVRQKRPQVYQETGAARTPVAGRYIRAGRNEVALEVGPYDHRHPLVIDPSLTYSTYLGGSGYDSANGIAVDSLGYAYVVGETSSLDFPTVNPNQAANAGNEDVFVTKLDPTGTMIVYSTYIGGSADDFGRRIAVDTSGNAYIAGETASSNFPVQSAYQAVKKGGTDAFVAKLGPAGNALVYSTFFGTDGFTSAYGIAVDAPGNAYVTGYADSGLPMVNALQSAFGGGNRDAFVAKFGATGSLVYSTYLGGAGSDAGNAIALDGLGNICVAGTTASSDFPTVNPRQASMKGSSDVFVAKLTPTGSSLVFSTYLGGDCGCTLQEQVGGIAADPSGNVYVTGQTASSDFPTQNALQPTMGGTWDAFVTAYNPAGTAYLYSTHLDGIGGVGYGYDIAVQPSGAVTVVGINDSLEFPLASPIQPAPVWQTYYVYSSFVTRLSPAGTTLLFSTYLGGGTAVTGEGDYALGVALDAAGAIYVAGRTASPGFPITTGAARPSFAGDQDAFVAKIDISTPPCQYSYSPASPTVPASGGVINVTVSTGNGCIWQASTPSSWITLSSGNPIVGPGTVSLTVTPNPDLFLRSGSISIAGASLTVNQDGQPFPCPTTAIALGQTVNGHLTATDCPSVSRGSGRYGDLYSFTATAGQQVGIELIGANFDTVLYLYGPGNQLLASNDDILDTNCHIIPPYKYCDVVISDSRIPSTDFFALPASGTYTIEATAYDQFETGDYTLRLVTPTSTNCAYRISPTGQNSPASGGSGTVTVSVASGCPWYSDYGSSWINVTSSSGGTGPGTVTYTVAPTPLTNMRSTTLVVANQRFAITQDGTACSFSLSASSVSVPVSGTTGTVNITGSSTCDWFAFNPFNWITSPTFFGTGSGTFTYTVAANPGVPRTGTMLIGGQAFTVIQSGVSTPHTPGDFNGDGHPDLLWQSNSTRQVTVHYFGGPQGATYTGWNWLNTSGAPSGWVLVGAADFDGNGVPDLVWENLPTGQVTVNYYGGPGGATLLGWKWLNYSGAPGWTVVAVADMNNDGVPDLIWQNNTTNQVTVNYYGGTGGAVLQGWNWLKNPGPPAGWRVVAAADFDGNGTPDLVWQYAPTRQVTVNYYGGAGGATYQSWNWLKNPGAPGWTVVGANDFDGNGVPDLVWQKDVTGEVTVNYYGGTGGATYTGWNWLNATGALGWKAVVPR